MVVNLWMRESTKFIKIELSWISIILQYLSISVFIYYIELDSDLGDIPLYPSGPLSLFDYKIFGNKFIRN